MSLSNLLQSKSNLLQSNHISHSLFAITLLLLSITALAQNKVVVVPLGEDTKTSQFRIVSTQEPVTAGHGRLEYTDDSKPNGRSLWGKVCDVCFEGGDLCIAEGVSKVNRAANLVCKDLGFETGVVDTDRYFSKRWD